MRRHLFDHLSARALEVMALAQDEARSLRHHYVGPEHVLLGLLSDAGGRAARALAAQDVTHVRVRGLVTGIVGVGSEVPGERIPLNSRGVKLLELAVAEAHRRSGGPVEPEHILLALTRNSDGIAARVLADLQASPEELGREVLRLLGQDGPDPNSAGGLEAPGSTPGPDGPVPPPDLGWRGRPVALAALGAARLAGRAFHPTRTGGLSVLQMQVLIRLALAPAGPIASPPGASFDALVLELDCERRELRPAIDDLGTRALVVRPPDHEEDNVALTQAGATAVERWLAGAIRLFGAWPGGAANADDATG